MEKDQTPPVTKVTPPYAAAPPYEGETTVITKQPEHEQENQATVRGGDSIDLICLILCFATGGASAPFWLLYCLIK